MRWDVAFLLSESLYESVPGKKKDTEKTQTAQSPLLLARWISNFFPAESQKKLKY